MPIGTSHSFFILSCWKCCYIDIGVLHFNSNKCFKLSTGHYRRQNSVLRGRLFPLENGATVVDEKSVTRGGVCLHHWEECK